MGRGEQRKLPGACQELAGYSDKHRPNRRRLPAAQLSVTATQCHPTNGIVGHYGTLEQSAASPEIIHLQVGQTHLIFGLIYPRLTRRPPTILGMCPPAAHIFTCHITEKVILLDLKQAFAGGFPRACPLPPHRNKTTRDRPRGAAMPKAALFPPGGVQNRLPALGIEKLIESFQLYFDQVAVPILIKQIEQGAVEKTAVSTKQNRLRVRQVSK